MTTCTSCGASDRTVMLGMEPGRDRRPWSLCVPCWREKGTSAPQSAPAVTPPVVRGGEQTELYGALSAKGTR